MTRPTYQEQARQLLKDRLLDAVDHLLRQSPWAEVTMAAIAADAGVSRQTVYNEFGSRDGVAQAYVLREAAWFIDEAAIAIRANAADPRAALRAALNHFLTAAHEHPLLQAIARGGDDDRLILTIHGEPVISTADAALAPVIVEVWPQISAADARVLVDALVRLALSHAAAPTSSPDVVAEQLTRLLGPFVDELLHGRTNSGVIAA